MIRKKDCCGCGDWKSMLKELWMKYQDVVKGVKAGGVTAYPDGDGIADLDDAVSVAVSQQIGVALQDYVTDDDLSAAIQYFVTQAEVETAIDTKLEDYQAKLVSGTNIKTINGNSVLGSGNLVIQGGGGGTGAEWGEITGNINNQTDLKNALDAKVGFTDYPTGDRAGVVKSGGGIFIVSGQIYTYAASTAEIDAATSDYKVITPYNVAYAVHKYGMKQDGSNANMGSANENKMVSVDSSGHLKVGGLNMNIEFMQSYNSNYGEYPNYTTQRYNYVNPITGETGFHALFSIRKINGESMLDTSSQLSLSKTDLSNTNVGAGNSGKFLKVDSTGKIAYDTPSGSITITDNTTYFTISY